MKQKATIASIMLVLGLVSLAPTASAESGGEGAGSCTGHYEELGDDAFICIGAWSDEGYSCIGAYVFPPGSCIGFEIEP